MKMVNEMRGDSLYLHLSLDSGATFLSFKDHNGWECGMQLGGASPLPSITRAVSLLSFGFGGCRLGWHVCFRLLM